ncbi:hypothetical protein SAMN05216436_106145 [bacterium A37T11]|nr:hypothetical protein SAMN05216436_106145 [bacterium A37T11]
MGIYNRWKELRDAEFAAAAEKGEEEACYWKWEDTISHYNPKAGMAFDPTNQSLKVHIELYLKHRKKQLRKKHDGNDVGKPVQLFTKLLWGALAVRFHYFYPTDYDYVNIADAADDFIDTHVSKKG